MMIDSDDFNVRNARELTKRLAVEAGVAHLEYTGYDYGEGNKLFQRACELERIYEALGGVGNDVQKESIQIYKFRHPEQKIFK